MSIAWYAPAVLTIGILLLPPALAYAQTNAPSDLRATIRAELLSDPRTSSLTPAQLDAMVNLLAQEAQKRGLTAQDITWRPQTFSGASQGPSVSAIAACGNDWTCIAAQAYGFVGPDTVIPFSLGAASMGLVWILAEMIHRRKYPSVAR